MSQSLKKEIPDQLGHFCWAGATFVAPWLAWGAWGVEMPAWGSMLVTGAALASLLGLVGREIGQKADRPGGILRHWPVLDSVFYGLGAVAGTVVGVVGF